MRNPHNKNRRAFVKTCVGTAALVAANPGLVAQNQPVKHYVRSLLVDQNDHPVSASGLIPDQAYIFHYPFVTTPCFLIDIGRAVDPMERLDTQHEGSYSWKGGVGSNRSLVAFSAICAHKLSYPTKTLSFLNYRPEKIQFVGSNLKPEQQKQLIYCCSERSAYDATRGATVLGGPARQPLAAIELEYDSTADRIYAVGTRGGELYDQFFTRFGFRLALDHKIEDIRASAGDSVIIYPHSEYSEHSVSC